MSKYDLLTAERQRCFRTIALINSGTGIALSLLLFAFLYGYMHGAVVLFFFISTVTLSILSHFILSVVSEKYSYLVTRLRELDRKRADIRKRIESLIAKYPCRNYGERFKTAFDLSGKDLRTFEQAIAMGMLKEAKEVWITAFLKKGKVVKVNATIGWGSGCKPSENVLRWIHHLERHEADEVRQYHNHPTRKNSTHPSPRDFASSNDLKHVLGRYSNMLRSFIVYWNAIGEWRIIEYDITGKWWLEFEFDAST